MEATVVYEAADGRRFTTATACEDYESLLHLVWSVMCNLPRAINLAHEEYAQHNPHQLRLVKRALFAIVVEQLGGMYPAWETWDADEVNPSHIASQVKAGSNGPLGEAWSRLESYDFSTGRQYKQPFYVYHPNDATKRIN